MPATCQPLQWLGATVDTSAIFVALHLTCSAGIISGDAW